MIITGASLIIAVLHGDIQQQPVVSTVVLRLCSRLMGIRMLTIFGVFHLKLRTRKSVAIRNEQLFPFESIRSVVVSEEFAWRGANSGKLSIILGDSPFLLTKDRRNHFVPYVISSYKISVTKNGGVSGDRDARNVWLQMIGFYRN